MKLTMTINIDQAQCENEETMRRTISDIMSKEAFRIKCGQVFKNHDITLQNIKVARIEVEEAT